MKKLILLLAVFSMLFLSSVYSQQRVKASYYADKFHGRKTASGKLYHRDSLTCAHKTLPFGTVLKVMNPKNDKAVYVKVTDRGPFVKGRTIDLSYAAAKKIGAIGHGVLSVDIYRTSLKQVTEPEPEYEIETDEQIETIDWVDLKRVNDSMDSLMIRRDNTKLSNDSIKLSLMLNKPIKIKTA